VLEYVFRPMWLRPMWPMYGTYIATLLGLALINRESLSNIVVVYSGVRVRFKLTKQKLEGHIVNTNKSSVVVFHCWLLSLVSDSSILSFFCSLCN
jgi:hypothetical protein